MIDIIIDLINSQFDGISENQIVLPITEKIYRQSGDTVEYMPGVFNSEGEAILADIDDINSLLIYHKTNAANLTYMQNGGYGDGRRNQDTISCSMISIWDRRRIDLKSADMMIFLRSRIPQEIRELPGIKTVTLTPISAILDSKQIFNSEYKLREEYLLPAFINFIQINYTILLNYDPECIDKCIDCKKIKT